MNKQRILLCKTVCSSQEYLISLNFICICTDTVAVLNYALFICIFVWGLRQFCLFWNSRRPYFEFTVEYLWQCLTCSVECLLAVLTGACSTQLFKPSVRTTCYFQGVFTTMALICVVFVCIYMCVKTILPYYSVTAQFKLTPFLLFLLLLLLCLYLARSLKGFLCVGVCSLAAVKRSSV